MEKERAAYTLLTGWSVGSLAWYRMIGKNIRFIPAPSAQYTVNLNGYPVFTKLTATYTDSTGKTILNADNAFDGINGWEAYVIWKVVAFCKAKQNVDPSLALGRVQELDQRIRNAAANRDMGSAERVQDVVGFPEDWLW
jgi:hypothetical protein